MSINKMIAAHPNVDEPNKALSTAIKHALYCAAICTSCADACLAEDDISMMRQCIRTDLDCADVCTMLASVATRRTGSNPGVLKAALQLCIDACIACADECASHDHDHCRRCAEMCRETAEDCRAALATL